MIYLDTETCGLTGPAVLIQYAYDDGPVTLHEIWNEPVERTLELCKRICNDTVCGFNLTYDWFHINKLYNLFSCNLRIYLYCVQNIGRQQCRLTQTS